PRRTRVQSPVPQERPVAASGIRFGWAAMVTPLVMGVLMAVLFSPLMAAFALCSPLMMLANWVDDRFRVGRQRRANARVFAQQVARFEQELTAAAAAEIERRWFDAPSLAEVVRRARTRSGRLWERRPSDPD